MDFDGNCPEELLWSRGNNTSFLEDSKKYRIEERGTSNKCKIDYVLSIFNVTENDEGRYICHWECEDDPKKAVIVLKVFADLPTKVFADLPTTGNK